ncbi:hypothetical protein VOI54_00780 [Tamlana sp. 2201CG12-4]|uniref:hypothetical protein n=1 Tax=Tamlana sp. 2201CG12-4 TaxID=3112582 RepID=UPI002DBA81C8|nr:hypothetical protein [Tamlana sp. 2201CG12-4]MEC3905542.1 hypothetical protein [Tamlana sp. 2201CG12-4]
MNLQFKRIIFVLVFLVYFINDVKANSIITENYKEDLICINENYSLESFNNYDIIDLGKYLDEIQGRIDRILATLVERLDIMIEARLWQLSIDLQNIRIQFAKDLNKSLDKVDAGIQNKLDQINNILNQQGDKLYRELYKLETVLAVDLHAILSKTVLYKEKSYEPKFSYIRNSILKYDSKSEFYRVIVGGTALAYNNKAYLLLEGDTVPYEAFPSFSPGTATPYEVVFEIPTDSINKYFKKKKYDRLKFRISTKIPIKKKRKKRKEIKLDAALILLPQELFKYEITEKFNKQTFVPCNPTCIENLPSKETNITSIETNIDFSIGKDKKFIGLTKINIWDGANNVIAKKPDYKVWSKYEDYYVLAKDPVIQDDGSIRIKIRDFRVSGGGRGVANNMFNNLKEYNRNQLWSNNLKAELDNMSERIGLAFGTTHIGTVGRRKIDISFEYHKSKDTLVTKEVKFDTDNEFLGTGTYKSELLTKVNATWEIKIYPTFLSKKPDDPIEITFDNSNRTTDKLAGFLTITLTTPPVGNVEQIRIDID